MPNGVALPSIQHALPSRARPEQTTLGQSPGADEDHEVEVPLGKRTQVLTEALVGRESQHLVGRL